MEWRASRYSDQAWTNRDRHQRAAGTGRREAAMKRETLENCKWEVAVHRPFSIVALLLLSLGLAGCTREIPPASVGIKFNANSGISERLMKPQVVWMGYGDHVIVYPTSIKNASY